MVDRDAIAKRVREVRELQGLTQAVLAERADVTTETISRLERGLYDPALSTIMGVADVLDVDIDFLCARAGNSKPGRRESAVDRKLARMLERLDADGKHALLRVAEMIG